ncbi:site-specific DNA-methyltransferase [Polynucleobacter paneuropaeus]|nr:site-specific DNA-methyltransferase [Polynucleobacter paneuropaeus]
MKKMNMQSLNMAQANIELFKTLFPSLVTESKNKDGQLIEAIDFDLLRQEFSNVLVDGQQERYQINWPGKRESLLLSNAPISKTLRPISDQSIDFDTTKNIFIEGDNLDALKLLQETYLEKVKVIYIDPPYNTGSDLIYDDDFSVSGEDYLKQSGQKDKSGGRLIANTESNGRFHSDWLSMIYPRIRLAKNILADDGLIFISIDDGEVHNLRKICDEIFGEQNFIANIVWQKKTSPDARMVISAAHDHILLYAKNAEKASLSYLPIDEERRKSFSNPDSDPRGDWASVDLTGQTGRAPKSQFYSIKTPTGAEMPPPEGRCWAMAESTFLELQRDNRIWFGADGSNRPRLKKFLSESEGIRPWTWWDNKSVGHNQESSQELKNLFDGNLVFDNPKPVRLIQRIVHLATKQNNEDIVLDFFGGSATTAHAVIAQNALDGGNRRFIMVQLDQDIQEGANEFKADSIAYKLGYKKISSLSIDRIIRAGKLFNQNLGDHKVDTGFRVLKVDSSNLADAFYNPDVISQDLLSNQGDNVKPDRTAEDLLFQVLLDWGVDLALPISKEILQGKDVYCVDQNALVACFDNNGGIDEKFVKELAKRQPLRVVFRDAGFKSDSVKINVGQLFKLTSPSTDIKCI